VGWSKEGLPIGVQVAGQRWKDEQLLAIAASLDELISDLRHLPSYQVGARRVQEPPAGYEIISGSNTRSTTLPFTRLT
jgi:hypothetical protein